MSFRFYIAGPMTGHQDYNFPAFRREAERLRDLGYEVVSPADHGDARASWEANMKIVLGKMLECDGLSMLSGWTSSRGARLEHYVACQLGMFVTYPIDEVMCESGPIQRTRPEDSRLVPKPPGCEGG